MIQEIDINLELAPADKPGFVRRPDVVVVSQAEIDRVDREGGLLRASEVMLVVEILSPSSKRTDYRIKRDEYAGAGVPYYWIIDVEKPVSLAAMHLAGPFGYQEAPAEAVAYKTTEPFPLTIEVDQLR